MRTKRRRVHTKWQHGFSLVEVLAALAIASVIIVATGALVHNVALSFDRGTRGVSEGERLILAIERLAADIGSTRFVQRMGEGSTGTGVHRRAGQDYFRWGRRRGSQSRRRRSCEFNRGAGRRCDAPSEAPCPLVRPAHAVRGSRR